MHFNWLDVILLIILGLTFILGLVKGLIRQVLGSGRGNCWPGRGLEKLCLALLEDSFLGRI